MLASLYSLFWFTLLALAAYGLGRPLAVGLGIRTRDVLAETIWSFAIGLLAIGGVLSALGLCGLLYAPVIVGLTLGVGAEGLRRVATAACRWWSGRLARARLRTTHAVVAPPPLARKPDSRITRIDPAHVPLAGVEIYPRATPPGRYWAMFLAALAAVAAGCALVSGLAPPTAGDALCYHLELPKVFLNEHAIRYSPDCEHSVYPVLTEMWFLWGLAVEGPVTAQLVHWGLGLLLAGGGYVLAEPFLGRPWARVVGLLVLLAPGVTNQMTAPLNDVALAAFCTLALAAWWQALDDQESHWAVIAGLMLGGALSIKHTGLVFAAAVAVPSLWSILRRSHDRASWKLAAMVVVVSASIAGPWYARAAWHTGDPVYPFLSNRHSDSGDLLGHIAPARKRPLGFNASDVLTAPWQLTMTPEKFGGRGHQLGAIFLAALPGLLLTRRLRGLGWLLAAAGIYAALWYCLRQNVRFLFPLITLALIPAAWVWAECSRFHQVPRFTIACLLLVLASSGAAASALRSRGHWPVATGLESRSDYLAREEPTYRFAQLVNDRLPADARICSQEQRAFYFERPLVRERMYRARTHYHIEVDTPLALTQRLRRDGFSHVLLVDHAGSEQDGSLGELVRTLEAQGLHRPWREVAEGEGRDAEGHLRRYRLLRLDEPHLTATRPASVTR